jgi:hypothetical protein
MCCISYATVHPSYQLCQIQSSLLVYQLCQSLAHPIAVSAILQFSPPCYYVSAVPGFSPPYNKYHLCQSSVHPITISDSHSSTHPITRYQLRYSSVPITVSATPEFSLPCYCIIYAKVQTTLCIAVSAMPQFRPPYYSVSPVPQLCPLYY